MLSPIVAKIGNFWVLLLMNSQEAHQYIKILTFVCLSVSDGSGMFVGRDYTIVTRDLRTLIYLLNLELREECLRTLGWNPAGAASRCGEHVAAVRSGHNRGAAAEVDAIGSSS